MKIVRVLVLFLSVAAAGMCQRNTGELRIFVADSSGASVQAVGTLVGEGTDVRREFSTGPDGRHTFGVLPFGVYRLETTKTGFRSEKNVIDIHSEHPME